MVLQTDVDFIRLQQRLRALPENYTLPKFASDCQEQVFKYPTKLFLTSRISKCITLQNLLKHLVPNHLDHEDEPSVLTSTSCLPNLKPDIKANNRNGVGGKPLPPNTIKGKILVEFFSILRAWNHSSLKHFRLKKWLFTPRVEFCNTLQPCRRTWHCSGHKTLTFVSFDAC